MVEVAISQQTRHLQFMFADPGEQMTFVELHDLLTNVENLLLVAQRIGAARPRKRIGDRRRSEDGTIGYSIGMSRTVSGNMGERTTARNPSTGRFLLRNRRNAAPANRQANYRLTRLHYGSAPELVVLLTGSVMTAGGISYGIYKVVNNWEKIRERVAQGDANVSKSQLEKAAYDAIRAEIEGPDTKVSPAVDRQLRSAAAALAAIEAVKDAGQPE